MLLTAQRKGCYCPPAARPCSCCLGLWCKRKGPSALSVPLIQSLAEAAAGCLQAGQQGLGKSTWVANAAALHSPVDISLLEADGSFRCGLSCMC